jgi:hypothetical protein
VQLKDQNVAIVEGALYEKVKQEDSLWSIEDGN